MKIYKKIANLNLTVTLNKKRITEAQNLLKTTDKNIGLIGKLVGFNNNKQFVKAFKMETGITPSEFRKMYRK